MGKLKLLKLEVLRAFNWTLSWIFHFPARRTENALTLLFGFRKNFLKNKTNMAPDLHYKLKFALIPAECAKSVSDFGFTFYFKTTVIHCFAPPWKATNWKRQILKICPGCWKKKELQAAAICGNKSVQIISQSQAFFYFFILKRIQLDFLIKWRWNQLWIISFKPAVNERLE